MAISKVKIQNFKSFKDIFTLTLNKGLNVLVGDNESGKPTILEAIHVALTGLYCGRSIRNELSQYLFNNETVKEYIQSIQAGNVIAPPELIIEIFFDEPVNAELFEGDANTERATKVQRQFKADEPNRVWVSDVTCFKINDKYLYVCAILDLFSRRVIAYRVSPKNSTYLITSTFRQAYQNRNAPQSLMFHSDQGAQYTSMTFRKLLRMNKVVQSFSAPGQPHDNAVMESFFSFMKREEIYRTQYKSEQQFEKSIENYIEFYNTQRPHSTLNYKTPDQFEAIHEGKKKSTNN